MERPMLAAVSLAPDGGGIAAVGRLLWAVFARQWPERARLVTLLQGRGVNPTLLDKTRFALTLARAQALGRTDWILFGHLGLATVQQGLPRGIRRPYGVFLHGIEVWRPLGRREREVLRRADLRLANSAFTAARTMALHPDVGPVEACPLALPPGLVPPAAHPDRPATLPPLGPHAVLVVGRMLRGERYKGHDQLIDAWPAVMAQVPDARLVMAGSGDDVERLRAKAARSPAAAGILFTGFVDGPALEALYRRAAVLALPSRAEGFGLVYLEAMAHRLPCVGSIHDAAAEVIADGQTGLLVDQDDGEAIAAALAGLLRDPARRQRMGEAAYRRIRDRYTFEHFADRLCGLMGVDRAAPVAAAV
jgi:phosphatidylinositol alpha-1,6-mannosyltransferase